MTSTTNIQNLKLKFNVCVEKQKRHCIWVKMSKLSSLQIELNYNLGGYLDFVYT